VTTATAAHRSALVTGPVLRPPKRGIGDLTHPCEELMTYGCTSGIPRPPTTGHAATTCSAADRHAESEV
jgi:hypothetical protein